MGAALNLADPDVIAGRIMQCSCAWRTKDIIKWPRTAIMRILVATSAEGLVVEAEAQRARHRAPAAVGPEDVLRADLEVAAGEEIRMAQTTAPDFRSVLASSVEKRTWKP
ncbi:hypothetical protein DL770_004775 [Monosporascus sp. CRB-9-2]|nr:hypothetical protein DL770_004775 [Monosporascus sp. CRB-9-2]